MKAKEKAIRYLRKNKCHPNDTQAVWYLPFIKEALDIAIEEVKKEVFDDIDKELEKETIETDIEIMSKKGYDKLKKLHLSKSK